MGRKGKRKSKHVQINFYPGTTVYLHGYLHGYINASGEYCQNLKSPSKILFNESEFAAIDPRRLAVKVYPNPTEGMLNFEFPEIPISTYRQIELFDIRGKRIFSADVPEKSKYQYFIGDKPSGVYVLRIISGSSAEVIKIVRQ